MRPHDPVEGPAAPPIRWYSYWPKWRRVMMSGAVILLLGAIARGFAPEEPIVGWVQNLSLVVGYFLLAYGFWLSHRARRDAIQRAAQRRDEEYAREAESVLAAHDPPHDGTGK